ncbi:unnamed protein product [Rhodiola kirilowii]
MATSISPFLSLYASTSTQSPRLLPLAVRQSHPSAVSRRFRTGFKRFDFNPVLCPPDEIGRRRFVCRAAEYKFPDPIPEFADAETEKFRDHLMNKLTKKVERYGNSAKEVVGVCTEIFSTFLHSEYGGPGTLMVVPFCDMADTINERGLPGGPQAARAAIKWAQEHVDKDWKEWTGTG